MNRWGGGSWSESTGKSVNGEISKTIRTLRLKVRREAYPWLNAAAIEVNTCWNWANALSDKAARPFAGAPRWLTAYELDKLSAGAAACFEHIGSDTIQRVNAEFATRRRQFRKTKLRWRVSRGSKRSLGWIPWKPAQLKRKGRSLRFSGKAIRVFEQDLLEGVKLQMRLLRPGRRRGLVAMCADRILLGVDGGSGRGGGTRSGVEDHGGDE